MPKNLNQQNTNSFNPDKIYFVFLISKDKKAYYLKNGDVWVLDLLNNDKKVIVDIPEEILSFDISNDQNLLAYSIKRNSSNDDLFSDAYGDTIILRNLTDSSKFELYSDKNSLDMQIRSILFSTDERKLFFSNNSIWVADLNTRELQKYKTKKNSFCSVYFLKDLSPDGKLILVRNGCFEGSSVLIFNITTGEVEGTFKNGYIGGGIWALKFLTNKIILDYNNIDYNYDLEQTETPIVRLGVYNLSGKLIKQIRETNDYPLFFDNDLVLGKIFLALPSDKSTIKNQSIYEFNPQTFSLSEVLAKIDVATFLYNNFNKVYGVWLTDNFLESPIFVDFNIKVGKYVYWKLM